ncbi:hypothetical protein ACVFYP_07580 [Roseomonas sp. F4]
MSPSSLAPAGRRRLLRLAAFTCLPVPAMANSVITTRTSTGGIASDLVGACERETHRAPQGSAPSWRCPICGCPGRSPEPTR